jgi:HK97 family phage portal protein
MAGAMASNGATPQGVLSYPGVLSDDAAANIRKAWTDINAGDNQGSVAILEEGLSYQQLKPNSFTDQQVVEALAWSASDIARLYNVPPTLIGLQKDSNRASSQTEERSFALRCLKPWGARIGDALGRLLLSDGERKAGLCIEVDLSELELSGVERGTYLRDLTGAGVLTANEARAACGYPNAPDGDRLRFPLNTGPADQLGASDAGTT